MKYGRKIIYSLSTSCISFFLNWFTTETLHFKGRDVCQNYHMQVAWPELQGLRNFEDFRLQKYKTVMKRLKTIIDIN